MVLVKEVDIKGFRGIKTLAKPVKLRKFNVLIGRNNVGKSAILQALYLLSTQTEPYNADPISFLTKLIGSPKNLVYGYTGKAEISYVFEPRVVIENVVVHGKSVDRLSIDSSILTISSDGSVMRRYRVALGNVTEEVDSSEAVQVLSKATTIYTPIHNLVERFLLGEKNALTLYIPNKDEAFLSLHDFVFSNAERIVKEGLNIRIITEHLNRVVYDKFTEVFPGPGSELYARKEVEGKVLYTRLKDFGEGVKRFTLVYLVTELLNPLMVLWDDVEVAMHPSLLDTALDWLARSDRQVVVSTHSIDVLNSVTLIEPRDAQVIMLWKDGNDIVYFRSLEIDEVEDLLDKHIDIRTLIEVIKE
jgi:energy-coupling factor transporter ATP-binding protein EcfA2